MPHERTEDWGVLEQQPQQHLGKSGGLLRSTIRIWLTYWILLVSVLASSWLPHVFANTTRRSRSSNVRYID